ncbi:hypothetical protein [Thiorhodococcus minor]|uniref:Uncharacterized protein n=1 Tax=Thiorhodococcus minor TaxID=57489 RepID=A0A6M0JZ68_9GAMM|nr:hypothetical protein [Thiorhodococcus minor]NEV61657.1 hypothetical protein [Thiorhodococcus minor]
MDGEIAVKLRPTLFTGGTGDSALFDTRIERAKADGMLYSAVLKTCKPDEAGKPERDNMGLTRAKRLEDRRSVQVIALSPSRLAERLRWLGLDVEAVVPWQEPVPEPEPTPEEIAAREAVRREVQAKLGIYPGHQPAPVAA